VSSIIAKKIIEELNKDESTYVYPQKQLPNVKTFKVELLSNHHPVFKEKGILKREFEPLIRQEAYLNKAQNQYIRAQFYRLNKCRHDARKF
jgi:hypothetical protein